MELGVHVDREACRATGQCVFIAPGVFRQDSEGISTIINPRGEPIPKIMEAVNGCIPGAISLTIDGIEVETWLADEWQRGALTESPLVPLLGARSEEHEALRQAFHDVLGTAPDGRVRTHHEPAGAGRDLQAIVSQVSDHLTLEEHQVFDELGALVDERLIDAFRRGHAQIAEDLHAATHGGEPPDLAAIADLAAEVREQISMEEDILFRVVLGALAHQRQLER